MDDIILPVFLFNPIDHAVLPKIKVKQCSSPTLFPKPHIVRRVKIFELDMLRLGHLIFF